MFADYSGVISVSFYSSGVVDFIHHVSYILHIIVYVTFIFAQIAW